MIEIFEEAGKACGIGHSAAQAVALSAQVELLVRWDSGEEVGNLDPEHPAAKEYKRRLDDGTV